MMTMNLETSGSKKTSKSTQHTLIKKYLLENKKMTPMDAWNKLYITKLSTRIGEMERKGMIATIHTMKTDPRTGSRYMEYTLIEGESDGGSN